MLWECSRRVLGAFAALHCGQASVLLGAQGRRNVVSLAHGQQHICAATQGACAACAMQCLEVQ